MKKFPGSDKHRISKKHEFPKNLQNLDASSLLGDKIFIFGLVVI